MKLLLFRIILFIIIITTSTSGQKLYYKDLNSSSWFSVHQTKPPLGIQPSGLNLTISSLNHEVLFHHIDVPSWLMKGYHIVLRLFSIIITFLERACTFPKLIMQLLSPCMQMVITLQIAQSLQNCKHVKCTENKIIIIIFFPVHCRLNQTCSSVFLDIECTIATTSNIITCKSVSLHL